MRKQDIAKPADRKQCSKCEILEFDEMLECEQPNTKIRSKLYISKSRKRIKNLSDEDFKDKEVFDYRNKKIWNGF